MNYELSITGNNATRDAGDTVVIELSSVLLRVAAVSGVSVSQSPAPNFADYHELDVRWSHDKMAWSAWIPYRRGASAVADPFPGILAGGRDFFLNVRAVRAAASTGVPMELTGILVEFSQQALPEQAVVSPFAEDGCRAVACTVVNACSGVVAACDPAMLWRPYESMGQAVNTYEALACVTAEMWGHCVRYFRIEPDATVSGDAVLKEYSVYDAVDVKDIKVLVPDNVFPDNGFSYTPFDMDFQEGLEVHILRQHFERAFGHTRRPQEKDFLYFPLLDRLFEVQSAYLFRGFMQAQVYYKAMLYKWQDRANVLRDRAMPAIDEYVDGMTTDFEELLRGEIDKQETIVTKPLQYRTISVGGYDHVRSQIHEDLVILEQDVQNYFTLVSKYHYNMSSVPPAVPAVTWKHTVSAGATESVAMSFWLAPRAHALGSTGATSVDPVVVGQTSGGTGISVSAVYASGTASTSATLYGFQVSVGSTVHSFVGSTGLTAGEWVGCVLNVTPDFGQISMFLWTMRPSSEKTTNLRLIYSATRSHEPVALAGGAPMWAPGGQHLLTNFRVWRTPVEEEKQPLVLNQYVVRDAHLAALIDNAVPPLKMPRTYVR